MPRYEQGCAAWNRITDVRQMSYGVLHARFKRLYGRAADYLCEGCPQQTGGDIGGTPCPVLGQHKDGYVCHSTLAGQFWGY